MRSIAILGCNIYSQPTVAQITLPKVEQSKYLQRIGSELTKWYELFSGDK